MSVCVFVSSQNCMETMLTLPVALLEQSICQRGCVCTPWRATVGDQPRLQDQAAAAAAKHAGNAHV